MCKTAKANRPGRLGVFVGITGTVVVTKASCEKTGILHITCVYV